IETARQTWGDHLPGDPDRLWAWCLEQDRDRLLDLLAFCAACSINAVQGKSDRATSGRFAHARVLAKAMNFDMRDWFTATAENFFGRITKPQILTALQEAKGGLAPAWNGMKKSELASFAEREIAGKGWLPEILRPLSEDEDLDAAA